MKIKIQLQNNGKNTGYFEMKAQGDKAKLIIYGEISSDKWDETEITPNEVKELLDSVKNKDLDIFINSSGGNVFAGLAIYHMLKRHEGKKTVYVDGIAASIASIIAMAGDEIHIPKNAYLMIHRSWICTVGNKNDLLDIIAMLEKTDLNMADIYYEKALEGVTSEKILELMDNETWLTGKEAQSFFKIIADGDNKAAACLDGLNINDKTPGVFKAKLNKVEEIQSENKEELKRIELEKAKLKLRLKMED